jgi:hypothetical protein
VETVTGRRGGRDATYVRDAQRGEAQRHAPHDRHRGGRGVRPGTHGHKSQACNTQEAKSDSGSGANASVWAGMQVGEERQYSSSDTCTGAVRLRF